MADISAKEEENISALNKGRRAAKIAEELAGVASGNPMAILSYGKKISKHWPILMTAALFDVLGMIPFIGIVFNFCFGGVLFFYFGKKKSSTSAKVFGIILPIVLGSVVDFFTAFFAALFPTNLAAALTRIAFKEIE